MWSSVERNNAELRARVVNGTLVMTLVLKLLEAVEKGWLPDGFCPGRATIFVNDTRARIQCFQKTPELGHAARFLQFLAKPEARAGDCNKVLHSLLGIMSNLCDIDARDPDLRPILANTLFPDPAWLLHKLKKNRKMTAEAVRALLKHAPMVALKPGSWQDDACVRNYTKALDAWHLGGSRPNGIQAIPYRGIDIFEL